VYPAWCRDGPPGAIYTATKSGWFDSFAFADWFERVMLHHARQLPGKKVMVGDNLSSHLSPPVISQCRENEIEFVCLPANSTDKMQPLDVGYFSVMKNDWRKLLRAYRKRDPAAKLLMKTEFPRMLKELLDMMDPAALLPPAFERCGLFPVDPSKVTCRLPSIASTEEVARHVDKELLKTLEVRRYGAEKKKAPARGKKIPAGMSYSAEPAEVEEQEELGGEECDDLEVEIDGDIQRFTKKQRGKQPVGKNIRKKKTMVVESDDSDDTEDEEGEEGEEDEDDKESEEDKEDEEEELPDLTPTTSRNSGKLVVVVYEGEWFVGEMLKEDAAKVPKGYHSVSYATIKGKNMFSWPDKKDIMLTVTEDILLSDITVEPKNSRGHFGLKQNILKKVETLMVVVYLNFYFIFLIYFFKRLKQNSMIKYRTKSIKVQ